MRTQRKADFVLSETRDPSAAASEFSVPARPNRVVHACTFVVCALIFFPSAILIGSAMLEEFDWEAVPGIVFLVGLFGLPMQRNLHALISPPYLHFHAGFMEIRHWRGGGRYFLPWYRFVTDRIAWVDIQYIHYHKETLKFVTVNRYLAIQRASGPPVQIHRWVFNKSLTSLQVAINSRLAMRVYDGLAQVGKASARAVRLSRQFSDAREVRHWTRVWRIVLLVLGPSTAIPLLRFLLTIDNPSTAVGLLGGLAVSCGLVGTVLGIDELVKVIQFRNRRFWLRSDGLAFGAHVLTAQVYRWIDVVGARRRVACAEKQTTRRPSHFNGLDIMLRDGSTLWMPETYDFPLDELEELLSPWDDVEVEVEVVEDEDGITGPLGS